ncbi:MAG: RecX family transcriptional regulator [Bdellovibrionales bacterium]|nr:RecX family transcriptional regulator [Bdellovibrionales bacterium]
MNFERLFELALKRLARRDRSLAEIRDYLLSKIAVEDSTTEIPSQIDAVLQKLVALKYLDEERMAGAIIRDQRLQSRGPRSAWLKLRSRGIEGWTLERVEEHWRASDFDLSEEQSEVQTARRWALRRYRGLSSSKDRKERDRALAALVRRGYSFAVARQAVDTVDSSEFESNTD